MGGKKWLAFSGHAPVTKVCAFSHVTNRLRHINNWNSEPGFSSNRRTPQKVHYPYCEGMVCKMCADKGTAAKITNVLSDSEKDK